MSGKEIAKPQIQGRAIIDILLGTTADKNLMVSESVNAALRKIAKNHPNAVLNECCQFYKNNGKLSKEHISEVLKSMEHICQEYIIDIDGDTIITLIEFAVDVMTQAVTYEPIVQLPASGILVALGGKHCIQVIEGLFKRMLPGVIPHYTVPYTLGSLAATNAFGIVPYLKGILEILIPLMAMMKMDYHKQAVSHAMGHFSDAINEYMLNIKQAPDSTITLGMFFTEMGIVYDILSSNWLYSKEPRVVESVLLAMSSIFAILSVEKVTQQTPKIIPTLLNLYRRQKEALPITQCLGSVIQVAALCNGTLLEPLLTTILHALGDLVCISPDYAQPELLRNHSEVLRCYDRLAMHFTDHCLDYIVMQLRNNNEKERIKALLILSHLSNSSDTVVQMRITVFLQVLSELLNEHSVKVKKAVLKTVVTFAYKGFLPKNGEDKYLEFIVKLCRKYTPLKNGDIDQQELVDLQTTADNTLYMLSTSVEEIESVLWKLLLTCLLSPEYSDSCITFLRCLTHLAARKQSEETCEAAFVRCLALLAQPLPDFRGTFILNFLKNIKLCKSDAYRSVWDLKIPSLIKYLEQNYDSFQYKEWEDLIFDFLTLVIQAVNDPSFNEMIILEAKKQLSLYIVKPLEKCLLLKCMAVATCHVKNEQLVVDVLNSIIEMVKLSEGQELVTCAEAVGICSRSHLKIVLGKLSSIRKDVLMKKGNKLLQFNFMNNQKNEAEIDRVRLLVLASYTEICNEAPGDILLQTVQYDILDFAMNELKNPKDFSINHFCLKTIGAVADALHPNRNTLHIQLQDRGRVLKLVSAQLKLHEGPEYIEMYPVTLPVISSLVRLPPALDSEERKELLKHCFNNIYNAAAIYCKINAESSPGTYYGDLKMSPFVYTSFSKLNFVVQELLMQSLSPVTLDEIVTLLEPWLGRKKAEQRLPALETLRDALQMYLDHVKFAYDGPTTFTQSGFLLARVVPRCTDPNSNIRKVGVESLRLILCITARYEGHMRDHDKVISKALEHVQEQIDSDKPKLLFNLTTDLAHAIISFLPDTQLPHFANNLMEALLDIEASGSSGSSVVLNTVLKNKGNELLPYAAELLNKLLSILNQIQCPRTRSSSLHTVLNMAVYHPKVVVGIILGHTLPYDQYINDCWTVLSTDTNVVCDILEHFKNIFKNGVLYEEHQSMESLRIVTLQPLQAICALSEIFKNTQLQEICRQQFPELFALLYIALASYIGTAVPATTSRNTNKREKYSLIPNRGAYRLNPTNICLETFKLFLLCAGYPKIAECLVGGNYIDNIDQFLNMIPLLTEQVCMHVTQSLTWIVTCLLPYSKSDVENQRVAVASFLATAIKYRPANQNVLTENMFEMLLATQADSSCMVRQLGLRGLGLAIDSLSWGLISRHSDNILNVFMQGLDYNNISNESGAALEAMLSFSKFLKTTEERHLNSCQVTAAMRIKPLFEQENDLLREAAFRLLGDLAASINHLKQPEAFKEQVCGNFTTLLLHLCDDSPDVVKACKYSLRKVGPFLGSDEVNNMIQDHLLEEGNLQYLDFITDLVKIMKGKEMLELFPLFLMTCVSYFKSTWVEIRGSAALLCGLLYSQLDAETRTQISFDTVCYRLLQLLKNEDENPQVRTRAIQATAYLFVT